MEETIKNLQELTVLTGELYYRTLNARSRYRFPVVIDFREPYLKCLSTVRFSTGRLVEIEWIDELLMVNHKIKPCILALQRLDEKSLIECLKKHNLKMGTTLYLKKKKHSKVRTPLKEVKRKRNVKPLCYTDDESDVDNTNNNLVVQNKICETKTLSETVNKTSSSIQCCEKPEPKISEQRMSMNVETNSFESKRKTEQYSPPQEVSTVVDSEIEIVQEFLNSEKKICKELPTAEEAEEDFESREDGEDDTCTVIFEDELHTEDVYQEKVVSKKFNEKEITNRKKQRLVKFKRKSMAGRNMLKFRKGKAKSGEVKGNPQDLGDKPTEYSSNEECLREVCGLVKRLHELLRIILQLQKELPNNGDLVIHFASVIRSQQENFNKEIRKSQKTIIKCYEKLMTTYHDTGRVALEICKRTFLNVEDVVNIISRCVIVEVYPDNTEKTENCPYKTSFENSEKALHRKPNRFGSWTNQQLPLYPCTADSVYPSNREPPDCPRKDFHSLPTKKGRPQVGPPRPDQFPQNGFHQNLRLGNGPSQHPIQCGPLRSQPPHITPQYYRVDFPLVNTIPRSGGFQQNPVSCSRIVPPLAVPSYSDLPNQVLDIRVSAVAGNFRTAPPAYKAHPMRRSHVDSVKYSNSGGSFVRPVELPETACSAGLNDSGKQVLDPTVPQKLTMRNSRLEAGPVLRPTVECSFVTQTHPRRNPSTEVDVSSSDSTSRKYVCAQNECKNPGVQICKRCRSVIYCSETCQLQHWTRKHKVECYQLMELRG